MRKEASQSADYFLLGCFAVWLGFGLIMLTSASVAVAHENFGDKFFFIKRQLLLGVLPGLCLFYIFAKVHYYWLKRVALPFFIFSLLLLLAVFIPGFGSDYGTQARSWLNIWGFSFQPAEFAKLALVVFIAAQLSEKGREIWDLKKGFLWPLGLGLIPIILVILQPDIGTVSILFAILFSLLFIGGARLAHLFGLAAVGIAGLAAMIASAPYRAARFMTFLHPELDPQGVGYHINQALLAIGSGGVFGRGLGRSMQKFQYLPEVSADSIYAIIAEEMGLIFAVGLIILLVLIVQRGLRLVKNAPDQFSRLLAGGLIVWLVLQSFLNIGAMVGIMPLTGVPLPFVSHGGTALMLGMAAVGILINISKYVEEKN
ncbi:MAG TPA: putative lipid II flippase FtsW [Patescibacteria group bacterium]|nr:putative lipid II flippase FtsW [Patescibacteria group bacterium]